MRGRISLVAGLYLLLVAGSAAAQQEAFAIDRYHAPPSIEDGLALQLPRTLGENRWSLALTIDYAHAPLVLGEVNGDDEEAIVSSQLVAHVAFAYGILDRFEVFAVVPVT